LQPMIGGRVVDSIHTIALYLAMLSEKKTWRNE
jgi:hypothetical protein